MKNIELIVFIFKKLEYEIFSSTKVYGSARPIQKQKDFFEDENKMATA
jgi:hypothetical protein